MKKHLHLPSFLTSALALFGGCGGESGPADASGKDALLAQLNSIISDPEHPLMAAAIGIVKDGKVLFADVVGKKNLKGDRATADTKFRIASISKVNTAIGVWQLIERGLLDPDADVSEYVGFSLRNPSHPDVPITTRMLLSHTSSIREDPGTYNIPYGHHIREFFTEGMKYHHPNCWAPKEEAPGLYFNYCNMNYCLLGSIVEAVSGMRFDRYMVCNVYEPMGLSCSYNVSGMAREVQEQVGTLYRKLDAQGMYDTENGVWMPQQDDFSAGYPNVDYSGYVIGTNGSLFGPMGSLRISLNELCAIMQMFCNGGNYNGVQILKPETVEAMFTPVWTYDPAAENGNSFAGLMNCYGAGPHIFTNKDHGDRMVIGQDLPFAGHTAEAYGLLGCMAFDRKKRNGIVYYASGLGSNPEENPGKYSSFYGWEEALLTAGIRWAEFDY